jgi:hypothetical protein
MATLKGVYRRTHHLHLIIKRKRFEERKRFKKKGFQGPPLKFFRENIEVYSPRGRGASFPPTPSATR